MEIIVEQESILLRDGTKITPCGYHFPPLQDILETCNACKICPIWEVCEGNNEFDCQAYGMFSGGNFYLSDLIKVCDEARKYRALKNDV